MKVKEESEKVGLKLNIQKTNIMAFSPITSWQIDGETMKIVRDFILGGFQNQCRWRQQPWNQKTLPPWKKSYDQPRQRIKKQRIYFVKAMVFPVVMYGCESWTIRKAKQGRIDAFWTVVLEETLESPLERISNQSIQRKSVLGVHWKDWCWSWNSNTLATWCKELTHLKRLWCW